MNTIEEKAFFTEQYADSPASLNPSCHCFFLLMIRSESGRSTLFAFRSILAGTISSLPGQSGGSNRISGHGGSTGSSLEDGNSLCFCTKLILDEISMELLKQSPLLQASILIESDTISDSASMALFVVLSSSSETWNLRANSSILFENSSSDNESRPALQALFILWALGFGDSKDRDLQSLVYGIPKKADRSSLCTYRHTSAPPSQRFRRLEGGDEIAEARVWEEEGEWETIGCDHCKQVVATFTPISDGKTTLKTSRCSWRKKTPKA